MGLRVEGSMRFVVSFALMFAVMMGAFSIGDHFGLAVWQTAVLAGAAGALSTVVERAIFKAWDQWCATVAGHKE